MERIEDSDQQASVLVDGRSYAGTWVFDSLFDWSAFSPDKVHYHALKQQFKGWEIETKEQTFNPQVATFLDFRTPQEKGTHFFYVFPISERNALVVSVLCTTAPVSWEVCEQAVRAYLETMLGIKVYQIRREEQGISLLTDWPSHGGLVSASWQLGHMVEW